MIAILTVALSTVSLLLLMSAFGHGREWWGAVKACKERDQAIKERDLARKERDSLNAECVRLVDLLTGAEAKRAEALTKVGQQVKEIQALNLRVETITKEAAEKARTAAILQATSSARIDELQEKVTGFKAYAAAI